MDVRRLFPEDLITAAEAATIAEVSEPTIRQWATRGKIHRFPGSRRSERTLYARPEIEAIVNARTDTALAA
jgi:predicted site-specific integrase-resolvase